MTRPKVIEWMKIESINSNFVILELNTESGTYIKEFVTGDLGRTVPSFANLVECQADILQLDVVNVSIEFPPDVD